MPHTYADAEKVLEQWVQNPSLRKHCLAVATSMRYFARKAGAAEDRWAAVGLLHDADFEKFPNMAANPEAEGHPTVIAKHLREQGWPEEVCRAILSHAAEATGVQRSSPMEKTLAAVDELSGFAIAAVLVRPDKNIANLEVSSVKKRLKDKAFARAVNRDEIARGAAELGVPIEDLIRDVIAALRENAAALGVGGTGS